MKALGISHDSLDATEYVDKLQKLGHMAAPVVMVVDGSGDIIDHWSGFRPSRLDSLAHS